MILQLNQLRNKCSFKLQKPWSKSDTLHHKHNLYLRASSFTWASFHEKSGCTHHSHETKWFWLLHQTNTQGPWSKRRVKNVENSSSLWQKSLQFRSHNAKQKTLLQVPICPVEFYACIQKWIQLTSKFFFSREHVAIIVVMQFPPRLKWRRQISYSRQIEWWKLEKKEETFLPQNNFASGCIKIHYLLSTEWCKPWSICKTKLSKLDLL